MGSPSPPDGCFVPSPLLSAPSGRSWGSRRVPGGRGCRGVHQVWAGQQSDDLRGHGARLPAQRGRPHLCPIRPQGVSDKGCTPALWVRVILAKAPVPRFVPSLPPVLRSPPVASLQSPLPSAEASVLQQPGSRSSKIRPRLSGPLRTPLNLLRRRPSWTWRGDSSAAEWSVPRSSPRTGWTSTTSRPCPRKSEARRCISGQLFFLVGMQPTPLAATAPRAIQRLRGDIPPEIITQHTGVPNQNATDRL